jgi:hypothetical protein
MRPRPHGSRATPKHKHKLLKLLSFSENRRAAPAANRETPARRRRNQYIPATSFFATTPVAPHRFRGTAPIRKSPSGAIIGQVVF